MLSSFKDSDTINILMTHNTGFGYWSLISDPIDLAEEPDIKKYCKFADLRTDDSNIGKFLIRQQNNNNHSNFQEIVEIYFLINIGIK